MLVLSPPCFERLSIFGDMSVGVPKLKLKQRTIAS